MLMERQFTSEFTFSISSRVCWRGHSICTGMPSPTPKISDERIWASVECGRYDHEPDDGLPRPGNCVRCPGCPWPQGLTDANWISTAAVLDVGSHRRECRDRCSGPHTLVRHLPRFCSQREPFRTAADPPAHAGTAGRARRSCNARRNVDAHGVAIDRQLCHGIGASLGSVEIRRTERPEVMTETPPLRLVPGIEDGRADEDYVLNCVRPVA